jgi:hypothetical protein
MIDISEKNLEATIEQTLLASGPDAGPAQPNLTKPLGVETEYVPGGYHRRTSDDYAHALCLIPRDVLDFIYATQPKDWEKFKKLHGQEARERLLKRLASDVEKRGTLEVLRKGIKCDGSHFRLAYFRPSSGLNAQLQKLYDGNLFAIARQLRYSEKSDHSLDLALFLNGLPLFTAELKNPLMGQSVKDAMRQYSFDRDTKEALFALADAWPTLQWILIWSTWPRTFREPRPVFCPSIRDRTTGQAIRPRGTGLPPPTCGSGSGRGIACSTCFSSSSTRWRRKTTGAARLASEA